MREFRGMRNAPVARPEPGRSAPGEKAGAVGAAVGALLASDLRQFAGTEALALDPSRRACISCPGLGAWTTCFCPAI